MVFDIKFTINLKKNISFEIKALKNKTFLSSLYEKILSDYIVINNNQVESFMGFNKEDGYYWVTLKANKIIPLTYEILSKDDLILLCIKTDILFKYIREIEEELANNNSNEIEESLLLIINILEEVIKALPKEEKASLETNINKIAKKTEELKVVPDKKETEDKKITIEKFIKETAKPMTKPEKTKPDKSLENSEPKKDILPKKKKKIIDSKINIDKKKNSEKKPKKKTLTEAKLPLTKEKEEKPTIDKSKPKKKKIEPEKPHEKQDLKLPKVKETKKPEIIIPKPLDINLIDEKIAIEKENEKPDILFEEKPVIVEKPKEPEILAKKGEPKLKAEFEKEKPDELKIVKEETIQSTTIDDKPVKDEEEVIKEDKDVVNPSKTEKENITIEEEPEITEDKSEIAEDKSEITEEKKISVTQDVKQNEEKPNEELAKKENPLKLETKKINETPEKESKLKFVRNVANDPISGVMMLNTTTSFETETISLQDLILNSNIPMDFNNGFVKIGMLGAGEDEENYYGWVFYIDGVESMLPASQVMLTGGETITWKYSTFPKTYTQDKKDAKNNGKVKDISENKPNKNDIKKTNSSDTEPTRSLTEREEILAQIKELDEDKTMEKEDEPVIGMRM